MRPDGQVISPTTAATSQGQKRAEEKPVNKGRASKDAKDGVIMRPDGQVVFKEHKENVVSQQKQEKPAVADLLDLSSPNPASSSSKAPASGKAPDGPQDLISFGDPAGPRETPLLPSDLDFGAAASVSMLPNDLNFNPNTRQVPGVLSPSLPTPSHAPLPPFPGGYAASFGRGFAGPGFAGAGYGQPNMGAWPPMQPGMLPQGWQPPGQAYPSTMAPAPRAPGWPSATWPSQMAPSTIEEPPAKDPFAEFVKLR